MHKVIKEFECIIASLAQKQQTHDGFSLFDSLERIAEDGADPIVTAPRLTSSFLIALAGNRHPSSHKAKTYLNRMLASPEWGTVASFFENGIAQVHREIEEVCAQDHDFAHRLRTLSEWVSSDENARSEEETAERIWSVFFPEANGIRNHEQECVESLRAKRRITITELNATPLSDPARQMLFTANALLTIPPDSRSLDRCPLSDGLKKRLLEIRDEPHLHFYDHPIQVGVETEKNEVLYGLRGLDAAIDFERKRGSVPRGARPMCALSVSVTHRGLQGVAKTYIEEELRGSVNLKNIDVYVFTETDTQRIREAVLAPAAAHYLPRHDAQELLGVFGVDGEYGRHYSFLKAIAPFWSILIQPEVRATFKIDLDQVFPQKELVEQTNASAFEHFKTPLWGSQGLDADGQHVELGMIAGALVNEQDIEKSLFTPDVPFPDRALSPDESIFFSPLPQALSTEAEMMTRYASGNPDGKKTCMQRIHVTGGTNGALVNSLRRYRPFTPSFIGRAEDQAYILSVLTNPGTRLGYVHKDGLIMRHDKKAFAQDAIDSAYVPKLVGDFIRIIIFSAYAGVLTDDVAKLKDTIDPFTGCFVSKIPTTVVYLRFALKAVSFFAAGKTEQGLEFIRNGVTRITKALKFVTGENSMLKQHYHRERLGWNLFYDTLSAIEDGLNRDDSFAQDLRQKAQEIVRDCFITF